jgi:ribonucleoside-triphosphate reductase
MIEKIRKRNGELQDFDKNKISSAIEKCLRISLVEDLTHKVISILNVSQQITVEEIQDTVEKTLMKENKFRAAKEYIIYRERHRELRNTQTILERAVEMVDSYLGENDWLIKENANMAYSLQGLNNYISSKVTKTYWLNKIYDKKLRDAHEQGKIHIHDLNLLSVYCCGWDLQDLLLRGLGGVTGKVESKPPKHFRTALGQIVNFFYTLQGEAAGAQAFSNFDTLLAPFVFEDRLIYEEVKQAMQEFIFNMNVPTRVGFQTPFTNITMDLVCPSTLANTPAIVGGKILEGLEEVESTKGNLNVKSFDTITLTYGEFQEEMDMINSYL